MRLALLIASAAVVVLPSMAAAQEVVPLPRFESIELSGGGMVTVHPGPTQRVTIRRGSTESTSFEVGRRGQLVIHACDRHCPLRYDLEIEVETPELAAAAVRGGGEIVAEGGFRPQGSVSAAVSGGGKVDLRALQARTASAAVNGGGKILVSAQSSLSAAVNGGGSIQYAGQPSVSTAIHGGGSVEPLR
jgi:hypothetical protein